MLDMVTLHLLLFLSSSFIVHTYGLAPEYYFLLSPARGRNISTSDLVISIYFGNTEWMVFNSIAGRCINGLCASLHMVNMPIVNYSVSL